jgi:predicted kinase
MRRFDVTATLDRIAEAGALPRSLITNLTRAVLRSHERAPLREGAPFVDGLERYIRENKTGLTEASDLFHADQVEQVTAHSLERLASAKNLLLARGAQGFVRRCHGDLHLGNIVVLEGEPTLFDAIEFDEAIATCDVLYDLAFLLMDLWARGLHENANLVFNRYLWESDQANLSGLAPVPLFLATRASIRAKVVAARLVHLRDSERDRAAADAARYFRCAKDVLKAVRPRMVAVGGLSGAGKSTLAAALAPYLGPLPGAVHLRSDIERKRMFGVAETGPLPAKAYQPHVTRDVYDLLLRKAALVLGSGCSVVIDAVHAHEEERRCTEVLARDFGLPFIGLWLEGDPELLLQRVSNRRGDASDANAEVVKKQVKIDVGRMNWHRLNAAAPITQALAAVRHILDDQ